MTIPLRDVAFVSYLRRGGFCGRVALLRLLSAVSAVLLVVAAPVAWSATNDERTWYLGGDERDPYLAFGNQDIGETALLLICNNRRKIVELSVADQSKEAKQGQTITIEVASSTARTSFGGKTVRSAGIYGYARKIDYNTVFAMFRAPGPITVTMGSNTYSLHDKGRAKAVSELAGACAVK